MMGSPATATAIAMALLAIASLTACDQRTFAVCGNGMCEPGEDSTSCSADCTASCGDGVCGPGETATTCVVDCGSTSCGDGLCDGNEDCSTCEADCGACCGACQMSCGDGICTPDEDCVLCEMDCGTCPSCGDGACDITESCVLCEMDCGACPAVCGDGTCDPSETPSSCAADCPCSAHTDCNGAELCVTTACESAYGRDYVFTVVSGNFPMLNPANAQNWDPIGPPDPFVEVCVGATCPSATTITIDDTYNATWNETFLITLADPVGDSVTFVMYDEDLNIHDFALLTPLGTPADWVNVVRTMGGMYFYSASAGLDITIAVSPQ